MAQKGILLINTGTPSFSDASSVRQYLREFLMDKRVIDLPFYLRWILVYLFIVPFRYKKTTAAYQKIWTKEGSPQFILMKKMAHEVAKRLGEEYKVVIGMRYGVPGIKEAVEELNDCSSIQIIPLFPQYASASSGSAIEYSLRLISSQWNIPNIRVLNDFYNHPGFIKAYAAVIQNVLQHQKIDLLIFSYHGLPERHIDKSNCLAFCDKVKPCPSMQNNNSFCYRAECYATSQLIANQLGLSADQYLVSFQSRLGRTPWIKPYSDVVLPSLIQNGIKKIAMVSPSFVVDCLETLEEINIRTREQWLLLGGETFTFIPCINDSALWIDALINMIQ